jgi:hypothetical protein
MQAYRVTFRPRNDRATGPPATIVVLSDEPAFRGLSPKVWGDLDRTLLGRYYPETATGIDVLGIEHLGEAVVLVRSRDGVAAKIMADAAGEEFRHPVEDGR